MTRASNRFRALRPSSAFPGIRVGTSSSNLLFTVIRITDANGVSRVEDAFERCVCLLCATRVVSLQALPLAALRYTGLSELDWTSESFSPHSADSMLSHTDRCFSGAGVCLAMRGAAKCQT